MTGSEYGGLDLPAVERQWTFRLYDEGVPGEGGGADGIRIGDDLHSDEAKLPWFRDLEDKDRVQVLRMLGVCRLRPVILSSAVTDWEGEHTNRHGSARTAYGEQRRLGRDLC